MLFALPRIKVALIVLGIVDTFCVADFVYFEIILASVCVRLVIVRISYKFSHCKSSNKSSVLFLLWELFYIFVECVNFHHDVSIFV